MKKFFMVLVVMFFFFPILASAGQEDDRALGEAAVEGLKMSSVGLAEISAELRKFSSRLSRLEELSRGGGSAGEIAKAKNDMDRSIVDLANKIETIEEDRLSSTEKGQVRRMFNHLIVSYDQASRARDQEALEKIEETSEKISKMETAVKSLRSKVGRNTVAIIELKKKDKEAEQRLKKVEIKVEDVEVQAKAADRKADLALDRVDELEKKLFSFSVEVGSDFLFSKVIQAGGMGRVGLLMSKQSLRLDFSTAFGIAFASWDFLFHTQMAALSAFNQYFCLGAFVSMFGKGLPGQKDGGYGGGAVARINTKKIRATDLFFSFEIRVGLDYEFHQEDADPPDGIISGATYNPIKDVWEVGGYGGVAALLVW